MKFRADRTGRLSSIIRDNRDIRGRERLRMVLFLSIPSILSQVSAVVMEYIDAAMVGRLGAGSAASIGLVATSTWLFMGLCSAFSAGFAVQVAHLLGAGREADARSVLRQSLAATLSGALILAAAAIAVSPGLPHWLGGDEAICGEASLYFALFAAFLPALQLNFLAAGMLRSSGNMVVPGACGVLMCVLDVVFNFFLIFPTREAVVAGFSLTLPGFGLGVAGAAVGTGLAETVAAAIMAVHLWRRGGELKLSGAGGSFRPERWCVRRAVRIGFPMGVERFVSTAAQITLTAIVAPLGVCAIAANAFAVTAEGICYMPGYGIGEAATTLVGQSIGAGRKSLARKFAYTTVGLGMAVMTVMGVVMYVAAPLMIGIMTPDAEIVSLGVRALRTEAFAEPMFAAAIVAYGALIGAGDTAVPCAMNLGSIWIVRVTLAALLAPVYGLHGVWIAMCVELCCRGIMFLLRLRSESWMKGLPAMRR